MDDTKALVEIDQQQINTLTLKDVKDMWCPLVTEKEFALFIGICKSFSLNPFKREIHLIKYSATVAASIVVGYEVYLKRADRTKKLDGWDVKIVERGTPSERAVITIHRKDFKQPFIWEVLKKEASKSQANWNTMPDFMLKKVAIGQGFRLAFPDEMGGLPYVQEEIVQDQDEPVTKPTITPHKTIDAEVVKTEEKAETKQATSFATEEQVKKITELVLQTSKPTEWSDYISRAFKVDTYIQLSKADADKIILELKEGLDRKDGKKGEVKEEEEKPKTGKPISTKQIEFINNLIRHYHEKKAGKLALLLLAEGVGKIEDLTSWGASNIIEKIQADIAKDTKEKKDKKKEGEQDLGPDDDDGKKVGE